MTVETVDEYLAALPADQRAALQKVRRTIKSAAPEATESISYQIPGYKHHGALVHFGAAKKHCAIYGVSDAIMESYQEELEPFRSKDSTLRFTPEKPMPASLIRKLVKARVKENEANRKK